MKSSSPVWLCQKTNRRHIQQGPTVQPLWWPRCCQVPRCCQGPPPLPQRKRGKLVESTDNLCHKSRTLALCLWLQVLWMSAVGWNSKFKTLHFHFTHWIEHWSVSYLVDDNFVGLFWIMVCIGCFPRPKPGKFNLFNCINLLSWLTWCIFIVPGTAFRCGGTNSELSLIFSSDTLYRVTEEFLSSCSYSASASGMLVP